MPDCGEEEKFKKESASPFGKQLKLFFLLLSILIQQMPIYLFCSRPHSNKRWSKVQKLHFAKLQQLFPIRSTPSIQ